MAEKLVRIPAGSIRLEGVLDEGTDSGHAALVCHPHPLYGGSMENNVVMTLQRAMAARGWSTLRFNFRGVGRSQGADGDGEGEAEDILAAVELLRGRGVGSVHLAGYSFGAWVALKALERGLEAASWILVSPPIDFLDFDGLRLPSTPCLITLGDKDQFCAVSSLRAWLAVRPQVAGGPRVEILPGCDHFYWDHEESLLLRVSELLRGHLG